MKKKIDKKMIIIILIIVGLIASLTIYFYFFKDKKIEPVKKEPKTEEKNPESKPQPKLQIVNEESKTRPYAVMINNNSKAWLNHAGLNDAYLVYEMIAEGGITRMMALFKDQTTERIGSVRSSRHYFLDYALENDAIYVHFGWSPQAQSDISTLGINNINGIYDGSGFWRDRTLGVAYEHTAYTNIEKVSAIAKTRGYTRNTNKELLLNYSIPEIGLEKIEGAMIANSITIPYSQTHTTSYQYNPETKTYLRSMNGYAHRDGVTKQQYSAKNIIIQKVGNYSMDSYGRQNLNNIGNGTGYYITNGYAVPIAWSKANRSAQTKYQYQDGTEITVNDGNTFIQIEPMNMTPTFLE